jgi:hypothetical protein
MSPGAIGQSRAFSKRTHDDLSSPSASDGEVGQQAFAVIREAIRKEGMVALGRVVFTSREHVIALERGVRACSADAAISV